MITYNVQVIIEQRTAITFINDSSRYPKQPSDHLAATQQHNKITQNTLATAYQCPSNHPEHPCSEYYLLLFFLKKLSNDIILFCEYSIQGFSSHEKPTNIFK